MMSAGVTATSLLERLASHAENCPNKTAFTFLGNGPNGGNLERTLTYRQLADETDQVAAALVAAAGIGLKKGDLVVLVYPPSLDFMVAFVACLKCGVVAVPVFPPHPARKDTLVAFTRIVKGCGARIALTSKAYNHMKKLGNIKANFGKLKRTAGNGQDDPKWPDQLQWIVTDDKSLGGGKKEVGESKAGVGIPSASDLAFLQYTSGSTSDPKGVMITHGNLSHNLSIITNELQAGEDTVVVSWLPQYHDMGLIGSYLGILYCGGSGYYMSPLSFLQRPMIWMEAVSKYKGTHLQAPNFAFQLISRKFGSSPEAASSKLDFSSVRHIINGAEPVTAESIDSFLATFGPLGLNGQVMFPTYGLAEHTVFVCSGGKQRLDVFKKELEVDGVVKVAAPSEQDEGDNEVTTTLIGCGYPANQGVDVRIVQIDSSETESGTDSDDMQCKEVVEDVVGEIWIRSPSKAAGYWNNADQTREAFRASFGDDKKGGAGDDASFGYLRTGDVGFLHNGELFICGRIKDLIIVGGRNYYPQDIEGTAQSVVDSLRPGCVAAFSVDPVGATGDDVALVAELREAPNAKVRSKLDH
jgi:acyl-CoA synthetase (AMP-forming)/AMP-acid ligase II